MYKIEKKKKITCIHIAFHIKLLNQLKIVGSKKSNDYLFLNTVNLCKYLDYIYELQSCRNLKKK